MADLPFGVCVGGDAGDISKTNPKGVKKIWNILDSVEQTLIHVHEISMYFEWPKFC